MMQNRKYRVPAVPLTDGRDQHFFGYYGKSQFDSSDTLLLGHKCDVVGRLQCPEDPVTVGVIDRKAGNQWMDIADTKAWNWQMGSLAQWLPGGEQKINQHHRWNRWYEEGP